MRRLVFIIVVLLIIINVVFFLVLNHKKNQTSELNGTNATNSVEVVSDTPDFTASFSSRDWFVNELNNNNFFINNKVRNYTNAKTITVKSLTIHLTNKPLKEDTSKFLSTSQKLPDSTVAETKALAMKHDLATDHLDLFVYVNPKYVPSLNKEELGVYFSQHILEAVYFLTHPPNRPENPDISVPFESNSQFMTLSNSLPGKSFIKLQ